METFLIYLLGCVLAYISSRYYETKIMNQKWTKKDRLQGLIFSIFSWLAFFITIYVIIDNYDNDDLASW